MTVSGVYAIYDTLTGDCLYVGQSKDIDARWKQHIRRLRNHVHLKKFTDWFQLAGNDSNRLRFLLLEECPPDDTSLNLVEIRWFLELNPKFYGKTPSDKEKWGHSQETRAKIKASGKIAAANRKVRPAVCVICFTVFSTKSNRAKYCLNCRKTKTAPKNVNKATTVNLICEFCDQEFTISLPKGTAPKYCSLECRKESRWAKSPLRKISNKELIAFHEELGMSWSEIARKFGVTRSAVTLRLREMEMEKDAVFERNNHNHVVGGLKTAHIRWHANRNILVEECEYCYSD